MNWGRKWSLQTRILILVVASSVSVLGIMEWIATLSAVHAIEDSVATPTASAARTLAGELTALPSTRFPPEYQERVREVRELEPNVVRVDVYGDTDGILNLLQSSSTRWSRAPNSQEIAAFHSGRAETFKVTDGSATKIFSSYPFQFADGRKGMVTVVSSLWAVNDVLAAHLRIRLYFVLGTIFFFVAAIVLVFRTSVYRSVRQLVEVMNRFRSGELSARADENLAGEFGELASHFNRMLEEIQGFNDHLKQQVKAATHELSSRNRQLQGLNSILYETQKRLSQAERLALMGQLTATFAHEIGSPLSAISTHLQMLLEDSHLSPQVRDRLGLANDQIDRVCSIVQNLLTSTRQPVRKFLVELEEIVRKVVHLLEPTLESRRIRFDFQGFGGPFQVEGDPDQLQQLFLNLFNNSLDAIRGSGWLSVEIRREVSQGKGLPGQFQIRVRDSGVGIPADRLNHIFEPFFTTKEFGKGSGLGLAASKEIVKQHGGQISIESIVGKGACFTIRLPEASSTLVRTETVAATKEVRTR